MLHVIGITRRRPPTVVTSNNNKNNNDNNNTSCRTYRNYGRAGGMALRPRLAILNEGLKPEHRVRQVTGRIIPQGFRELVQNHAAQAFSQSVQLLFGGCHVPRWLYGMKREKEGQIWSSWAFEEGRWGVEEEEGMSKNRPFVVRTAGLNY